VTNTGSVSNPAPLDLRASYSIVDGTLSDYTVRHLRVEYDCEAVVRTVKRSRHPSGEYIISHFRANADRGGRSVMGWTSVEEWDRLKAGLGCPMCADIHLDENEFSYKVSEFEHTYVRLPKNQYQRGWTLVVLKRHAAGSLS
jgi:hypothetical protein